MLPTSRVASRRVVSWRSNGNWALTDKRTDTGENITSFATVIITTHHLRLLMDGQLRRLCFEMIRLVNSTAERVLYQLCDSTVCIGLLSWSSNSRVATYRWHLRAPFHTPFRSCSLNRAYPVCSGVTGCGLLGHVTLLVSAVLLTIHRVQKSNPVWFFAISFVAVDRF